MACKPATPAPRIRTLAGLMLPAAVIIIGKYLGRWVAASRTALYPAMDAMEDSTSIDWASVVLGIMSKLNPCNSLDFSLFDTSPSING